MNRERLAILRDHLASLPDERVDMSVVRADRECGTVACIAGWTDLIFGDTVTDTFDLSGEQVDSLIMPRDGARHWHNKGDYTRTDAIAAIQSMLDSPDDDALPVWPEKGQ
jgi:hypothetical protein